MENVSNKKLKGNVTIRTKAAAGERLDTYLSEHPELSEPEVTAAALDWYFDMKASVGTIEIPSMEQSAITPG